MATLEQNATELRNLVAEFRQRFHEVDAAAANGPHASLSLQELRVVERLGDGGRTRMKELAEHLLLAVNSVTSLVDKLEAQGLVRRERSTDTTSNSCTNGSASTCLSSTRSDSGGPECAPRSS